jgi:SpoVK/Ycf46/Vps4 family AAA+-type ATPase
MSSPILSFLNDRFGGRRVADVVVPERTFADVILPRATRAQLEQALAQVRNHALIFERWGLGERHATGLGLAFNFAGPPGTGKTICAEAIAHALRRPLLVVNYAEVESMWAGETPKNVTALFRSAEKEGAVLFFDEADAIAARRHTGALQRNDREANTVVNVLLHELEHFDGVVIFATNLAVNFDPAFERRIRTHVLFEMPGVGERARIWRVQLHPQKTPLAADVDFEALAERYAVSGGDIRTAVLKAATMAAAERGPDVGKRIQQRHFVEAMEEVLAAKQVMRQSIFDDASAPAPADPVAQALARLEALQPPVAGTPGTELPAVATPPFDPAALAAAMRSAQPARPLLVASLVTSAAALVAALVALGAALGG